jgi:hypothetical protein
VAWVCETACHNTQTTFLKDLVYYNVGIKGEWAKNVFAESGLGIRILLQASASHDAAISECNHIIKHTQDEKKCRLLAKKIIDRFYESQDLDARAIHLPKEISQNFITKVEPIAWFDHLFVQYGLSIVSYDLKLSKITISPTQAQLQP